MIVRDDARRVKKSSPARRRRKTAPRQRPNKAARLDYIHHPSFSLPGTDERLWGPGRRRISVPPYALVAVVGDEPSGRPAERSPLSREDERTLFLRLNYAKYRLNRLLDGRDTCPPAQRKQGVALWRKRIDQVRETLVNANLPLVPKMVRYRSAGLVDFEDLLAEGYMAVLRSIDKFDVSRGYKFSTYACRSILAACHRATGKARTVSKHFVDFLDPDFGQTDAGERRDTEQRELAVDALQHVLRDNEAALSEVEARVVRERYFQNPGRRRPSLATVGQRIGLSNERVRQIERSALSRIGQAFENHWAA